MQQQTLTSSCVVQIRQLIISGELLPNTRIKGEFLKNKLAVGLSPIREALFQLSTTGLVEFIDNIGFKVASLNATQIYDVYSSFAKLEILLLQESLDNGDELWEAQIMARLYRLAKVEDKPKNRVGYLEWSKRNEEFHHTLIDAGRLVSLKNLRLPFLELKEWYANLAYPDLKEHGIFSINHNEHQKIAELALQRKADAASAMLYKHTLHGVDNLVRQLAQRKLLSS